MPFELAFAVPVKYWKQILISDVVIFAKVAIFSHCWLKINLCQLIPSHTWKFTMSSLNCRKVICLHIMMKALALYSVGDLTGSPTKRLVM